MELEQRAIHERQRITSGDIHYHLDREAMHGVESYHGLDFRIAFRPGSLRFDGPWLGVNAQGLPAVHHVCLFEGKSFIQFDDEVNSEGQSRRILIDDIKNLGFEAAAVFDPLTIGMHPGPPSPDIKLNEYLTRADRNNDETVTREQLGDREVFHIRWTRKSGSKYQFWISPNEGYSVLKIVVDFHGNNYHIVDTNDISVKQYGAGAAAVWYPEKVVSRRTLDDLPTPGQTFTITEAILNEPVDDQLFELASMKPNPGQAIDNRLAHHKFEIWDGEKIATVQFSPATTAGKEGLSWGWLAVSIAAGVAGAVVFWRYYRGSRARA
ncbi:MAG TPA: hypothetical protein VFE24_03305 [Pirellulales bacterium]|nr:hypothetical protein [Pirellulales bacterium]